MYGERVDNECPVVFSRIDNEASRNRCRETLFQRVISFFFSSSFFFKVFYLGKQEKDRSKDVTRIIIREFIFSIRVYTNVFKNFVINIVLTKLYEFNI